ncbi:zinc finger protein 43 [Nilaparvata lugens]|uniref:zinc finger protein 43 n=1 Tax=Nilaparvata lugens TaxID=108931 RepID=UPI00193C9DF1|nr:zinc finger protein 43 [Nilaparvata lugens]
MSLNCCVPGCDNAFDSSGAEKSSVTFHSFPKNELPRIAWLKATGRRYNKRVSAVVCSDHFNEDDFVIGTHKLMLKRTAVPCIFTPDQIQLLEQLKTCPASNEDNVKNRPSVSVNPPPVISMTKICDRKLGDMSLLCRICARRSDRLISLFEGEGLDAELALKMHQYLSLNVTEDDDLPKKICLPCATALVSWHDIVLMSIDAIGTLNALLESDNDNKLRSISEQEAKRQRENELSASNNGILQNQQLDSMNTPASMDISGELDPVSADKTPAKNKIKDLQEYKLHYPWKYHEIDGTFFLRTKVLGFEPAAEAYTYICCLCCEEFNDRDVIGHSKSHYPLQETDSCQLCHFSFSTIELLRNHIKRHMIIIDDQYLSKSARNKPKSKQPYRPPKVAATPKPPPQPKKKPPYVCEYCGIEYMRKSLYDRHVRNQHLAPFKCRNCPERFDSHTALDSHRLNCQRVKVEPCESDDLICKCNKSFNTFEEYNDHTLTCDEDTDLLCEECGLVFQTNKEYKKHNMTTHSKIPVRKEGATWMCEICGCKLGKYSARKHYMTHSFKEKKFTCKVCDMNFLHRWSLANHMQSHSNIRPFVCEICSRTFKRSDHLREHQLNKHQIGKSKHSDFKCDICNRYFTTETYLIRHKRLHSTGMSYECRVCKGRFPTEHSLKMHQTRMKHDNGSAASVNIVSTSSSDRINKFRCKACFKRYGSMASLKKHRLKNCPKLNNIKDEVKEEDEDEPESKNEENEDLEKTYECPKCNLRYLTDFGLKLHFARSKHSDVLSKYKKRPKKDPNEKKNPRFKCVQCGDIFSSLVSLRMHKIKRKHFSQCPHCGKRFAMEFKLKVHLVKVHQQKDVIVEESDLLTQEEKLPYQCDVCSQLFAMKHNLEAHIAKKHSVNANDEPLETACKRKPKVEPVDEDVYEEFTQEISVIYHCTECWENFASEEDFNNHTHEASIILTEELTDNAIISEVIETES